MNTSAVFPLGTAYLPGDRVSLNIFEDRYLSMIHDVMDGDQTFVSVLIERGSEVGGEDLRHRHGVFVHIESVVAHEELVLVSGIATAPCDITQWLPDDPYPRAYANLQPVDALDERQKYDIASSLTLLAQEIRLILDSLSSAHGSDIAPMAQEVAITTIAAGRWWDQRVEEGELWRTFWLLARNLPCGPFDRYAFLTPGSLNNRVKRLKQTVDHVREIVSFRFGD